MKPVAIFRHARIEGPGYFATTLERRSIPWRLVAVDEGEDLPRDASAFAGLAFMGGPMSVNDPLPWIARALELIRDAVRKDVPVIGHCLGGQLIARAFGGEVHAAPVTEIGWGEVRVAHNALAREWFGELQAFESFHWHGEGFSVPPGATRLLTNEHCPNQAFALGRHFGMQCHVEMTAELVRDWCEAGHEAIAAAAASPAVQRPEDMLLGLERRVDALHEVADLIYERWCEGLSRGS
jgi:GMP synthase-like glutamine amidotransferase